MKRKIIVSLLICAVIVLLAYTQVVLSQQNSESQKQLIAILKKDSESLWKEVHVTIKTFENDESKLSLTQGTENVIVRNYLGEEIARGSFNSAILDSTNTPYNTQGITLLVMSVPPSSEINSLPNILEITSPDNRISFIDLEDYQHLIGDNFCDPQYHENIFNSPNDCNAGSYDNICTGTQDNQDGICDPDCLGPFSTPLRNEDTDCIIPTITIEEYSLGLTTCVYSNLFKYELDQNSIPQPIYSKRCLEGCNEDGKDCKALSNDITQIKLVKSCDSNADCDPVRFPSFNGIPAFDDYGWYCGFDGLCHKETGEGKTCYSKDASGIQQQSAEPLLTKGNIENLETADSSTDDSKINTQNTQTNPQTTMQTQVAAISASAISSSEKITVAPDTIESLYGFTFNIKAKANTATIKVKAISKDKTTEKTYTAYISQKITIITNKETLEKILFIPCGVFFCDESAAAIYKRDDAEKKEVMFSPSQQMQAEQETTPIQTKAKKVIRTQQNTRESLQTDSASQTKKILPKNAEISNSEQSTSEVQESSVSTNTKTESSELTQATDVQGLERTSPTSFTLTDQTNVVVNPENNCPETNKALRTTTGKIKKVLNTAINRVRQIEDPCTTFTSGSTDEQTPTGTQTCLLISEKDTPESPICNNGKDDDGNGFSDYIDSTAKLTSYTYNSETEDYISNIDRSILGDPRCCPESLDSCEISIIDRHTKQCGFFKIPDCRKCNVPGDCKNGNRNVIPLCVGLEGTCVWAEV